MHELLLLLYSTNDQWILIEQRPKNDIHSKCLAQLEPSQHDAFKQRFRHSYSNVNKMMEYDRFNGINTLKWKKTGNREYPMPE